MLQLPRGMAGKSDGVGWRDGRRRADGTMPGYSTHSGCCGRRLSPSAMRHRRGAKASMLHVLLQLLGSGEGTAACDGGDGAVRVRVRGGGGCRLGGLLVAT